MEVRTMNEERRSEFIIHRSAFIIVFSAALTRALASLGLVLLLIGCHQAPSHGVPVQLPPLQEEPTKDHVPPRRPASMAGPRHSSPAEEKVVLAATADGREIEMFLFGRDGETILIMGGFHGNESAGVGVAQSLVQHLRAHPDLYRTRQIAVIPVVNPDGLARGTRGNRSGIDINRNFPACNFPGRPSAKFAGGRCPASEAETCAVLNAVHQLQPARIVSIHSIARGRHGNNYDGPGQALAAAMSRYNGYPVLPTMGYETPGSFGSWAGVDHHIPTITLELPGNASDSTCWQENREALLAAILFDGQSGIQVRGVDRPGLSPRSEVGK